MNKMYFVLAILVGFGWCTMGEAIAAPQQGLLVDETGQPIAGYSTVIIDDSLAYPVRNLETNTWYSVIIVGTKADGTILCTVGEPLEAIPEGVGIDEGGAEEEEVVGDDSPKAE